MFYRALHGGGLANGAEWRSATWSLTRQGRARTSRATRLFLRIHDATTNPPVLYRPMKKKSGVVAGIARVGGQSRGATPVGDELDDTDEVSTISTFPPAFLA